MWPFRHYSKPLWQFSWKQKSPCSCKFDNRTPNVPVFFRIKNIKDPAVIDLGVISREGVVKCAGINPSGINYTAINLGGSQLRGYYVWGGGNCEVKEARKTRTLPHSLINRSVSVSIPFPGRFRIG